MRTAVLLSISGLILAACSPSAETPPDIAVPAQAQPTEEVRDFSDFEVAQAVVQEFIDRLGGSDAGRASEGYTNLISRVE